MTEEEARAALADVPRETFEKLQQFIAFLTAENAHQNLVSSASLSDVWSRHILDSAQLIRFAPDAETWLDLGSGAGFPGLAIALLHRSKVTLVESRRKRADFLERAVELLDLADRAHIVCARLQNLETSRFDAITARAFAPLDRLLPLAERFAAPETRWILPKGRNAKSELDAVRSSWQGEFRLEPSLTDAHAQIIVAQQVRRRGKDRRAR